MTHQGSQGLLLVQLQATRMGLLGLFFLEVRLLLRPHSVLR